MSRKPLSAATDDAPKLASAAVNDAKRAVEANDRVALRQAAEKGWLAASAVADVAARKLGLDDPKGSAARRKVLRAAEDCAKRKRDDFVDLFEFARTELHGRVFHGDEIGRPQAVVGALEVVENFVERATATIDTSCARKRKR